MLICKKLNIFDSGAEALVNPVNCMGIMGAGLALQFKNKFRRNFDEYRNACLRGEVQIGRMFVTETGLDKPKYIINFPTKRVWWDKSRLEWIEAGLPDLAHIIRFLKIKSIAVPMLGCGLGGLNKNAVKASIERALSDLENTEVFLIEEEGKR